MFNIKCVILGALLSIPITLGIINIHEQFKTDQFKQSVVDKYNLKHKYDFLVNLDASYVVMNGDCSKGKLNAISISRVEDNTTMNCYKYDNTNGYGEIYAGAGSQHFGPLPIKVDNEGHITEDMGTIEVPEGN